MANHNAIYTQQQEEHFEHAWLSLQQFFKDCRPDMHEPDEQGIDATWRGKQGVFDNAGTPNEMGIVFHRAKGSELHQEREILPINLCDLIAVLRYVGSSRDHYHKLYSQMDEIGSKIVDMLGQRRTQ